jgi:hypothetical protein
MTTAQPLEVIPDIGRPEAHDPTIVPRPPATSKPASGIRKGEGPPRPALTTEMRGMFYETISISRTTAPSRRTSRAARYP